MRVGDYIQPPSPSDPAIPSIYGVSGSFAAYPYIPGCSDAARTCGAGRLKLDEVANTTGVGGSYIRIGLQLSCNPNPPASYWRGSTANADGDIPNVPAILHWGAVNGLIPIIDLLPPSTHVTYPTRIGPGHEPTGFTTVGMHGCAGKSDVQTLDQMPSESDYRAFAPQSWNREVAHFVNDELATEAYPSVVNGSVYFEIGNEVASAANIPYYLVGQAYKGDYRGQYFTDPVGGSSPFNLAYAKVYASTAVALQHSLQGQGYKSYHILTGSILSPTSSPDRAVCGGPSDQTQQPHNLDWNTDNYTVSRDALIAAYKQLQAAGVRDGGKYLGIAVHPYHYNTKSGSQWRNYYAGSDSGSPFRPGYSPCGDLDKMLSLWTGAEVLWKGTASTPIMPPSLAKIPLVFTETNWTTNSNNAEKFKCPTSSLKAYQTCLETEANNLSGAYVADLFTYLKNYPGNLTDVSSRLRVMWYRGTDDGEPGIQLGIYHPGGSDKEALLSSCSVTGLQANPTNRRHYRITDIYRLLRHTGCY